ncbi:MAG: DUF5683 domain-containing protein [Bacteroidales bacterium]
MVTSVSVILAENGNEPHSMNMTLTNASCVEFTLGETPNFEQMAKASNKDTSSILTKSKREKKKQNLDWSKKTKKNPTMAGVFSAVLPGLGQVYNGQWYKAPVIYAGAGVLYYFINMNVKEKRVYENEIFARTSGDSLLCNPLFAGHTYESILDVRNYYQNNFELSIIIASVVYLLNIVDAVVYAHLFTYDVSPNLTLSIKPYAQPNFMLGQSMPLDAGLKFSMRIR